MDVDSEVCDTLRLRCAVSEETLVLMTDAMVCSRLGQSGIAAIFSASNKRWQNIRSDIFRPVFLMP
jgi:hypothetical protein